MTAPVASSILLPDDTSNGGKKVRTQTKSVGGQTVHEHFYVPSLAMTLAGKYFYNSAQKAIIAGTHDGTSTGLIWLQNPVASTITALIREILLSLSANAATVAASAPRITFQKFSFTGTASGATEGVEPAQTGMTAAQMIARTAVTGMTVTLKNRITAVDVPAILTAAGVYGEYAPIYGYNPQAFVRGMDLELAPGEGIVIYQPAAGSTSDPRVFSVSMEWDEMDLS